MTEQRYETGPSGSPPPADDQTREMRAVDVLREDADAAQGGSTPLGQSAEVPAAGPPAAVPPAAVEQPAPEAVAARAVVPGESARPFAGAPRVRLGKEDEGETAPGASEPAPAGRRARTPAPARTRRARLQLRRVDPFSVFLLALLLSLFLAIVIVVAVVALYGVLAAAGVPDTINDLFAEITRASGEAQAQPEPLLTARRAVLAAGVIAAVDVVLLTALATLGALLYNVCASFTGGLTVTLAEPEDR